MNFFTAPVNEIVAEPELALELAEAEFVLAPADGEVFARRAVVAATLHHLKTNSFHLGARFKSTFEHCGRIEQISEQR